MKRPSMKIKLALAAAVFTGCCIPAYGQNTEDVMHPLNLEEQGTYTNPAVEIWKDHLDKANAERRQDSSDGSTKTVPGYIFTKEFTDGDVTVLASIYRAWDRVCDNGPNSSTSTITWATCPVRLKITEGGRSRIVEDTVCATTDALSDPVSAPDDKNYAAFVPGLGIQFNVASKGRYARDCTKLVRLGKAGSPLPSLPTTQTSAQLESSSAELFLGSMLPGVKVEKLTGRGTSQAVAEGRLLESEMKAACEGVILDPTAARVNECVREMKAKNGRAYRATADCAAGTMQPAIGGTWTYAGVYTPSEAFGDKGITKWRDANGQIQPVGRASDAYSLDQNWKILCGEKTRPGRSTPLAAPAKFDPEKFGGMSYDHNGSAVLVNEKIGEIRYETPKKAIAGTIRPGTLLFKGTFREMAKPGEPARGTVEGTAYVQEGM